MVRLAVLLAALLYACQGCSGSTSPARPTSPEAGLETATAIEDSIGSASDGTASWETGASGVTDDELTGDQTRDLMIAGSIAAYSGNCPCPYFTDSAGRRCGARSAYSKPGGASPLCYHSDISDKAVEAFRGQ